MNKTYSYNSIEKREMLKSMTGLMPMGGFICDEIEEQFYELYPEEAFTKAKKYCHYGREFGVVVDAVADAIQDNEHYAELLSDDDLCLEPVNPEFMDWVYDQIARLTTESLNDGMRFFWITKDLSREAKRVLRWMNVLDERVFCLAYGLGNTKNLDTAEIARLPEFDCSEEYIIKILDHIDEAISVCETGMEEIMQECTVHRAASLGD